MIVTIAITALSTGYEITFEGDMPPSFEMYVESRINVAMSEIQLKATEYNIPRTKLTHRWINGK